MCSLHSSGFSLSVTLWNLHQAVVSISEVHHSCWPVRTGLQSDYLIIPKVWDVVKVRDLWRPVKIFHAKLGKPFL